MHLCRAINDSTIAREGKNQIARRNGWPKMLYVLALIATTLRWNGHMFDLVFPINCILLLASVPISQTPVIRFNHETISSKI
jgi:hypothetical protein